MFPATLDCQCYAIWLFIFLSLFLSFTYTLKHIQPVLFPSKIFSIWKLILWQSHRMGKQFSWQVLNKLYSRIHTVFVILCIIGEAFSLMSFKGTYICRSLPIPITLCFIIQCFTWIVVPMVLCFVM